MRKRLLCLLAAAALSTACVQVRMTGEPGGPMISFSLMTSTPRVDAETPGAATEATTTPASTGTQRPTAAPSPTPTVTLTLSPTPCLPDATFDEDVTVPDGAVFAPGEPFVKVWRIRSSGCAPWPAGARWVFVSGDRMSGPEQVDAPDVPAGETGDVAVALVAPGAPGTYRGLWQMQGPDGISFGERCYVTIVVTEPTAPPRPGSAPTSSPPTPVPTPPPPPP